MFTPNKLCGQFIFQAQGLFLGNYIINHVALEFPCKIYNLIGLIIVFYIQKKIQPSI